MLFLQRHIFFYQEKIPNGIALQFADLPVSTFSIGIFFPQKAICRVFREHFTKAKGRTKTSLKKPFRD